MHRSLKLFLITGGLVVAGACSKADDAAIKTTSTGETNTSPSASAADDRGHSMVRVVNAVLGGKDVAVQLGDLTLFEGVKGASVTDYREISTNLATFSVRAPGASSGVTLSPESQMLMDGNRYTVFYITEDVSKNILKIVKDDVVPDSGKARLRIIHAAPGAPEIDVTVVGATDRLFDDINFSSEAGYKDMTPASVVLEVRANNESKVLMTLPAMELKRGTATTVVITGTSAKLSHFKFTDTMLPVAPKM